MNKEIDVVLKRARGYWFVDGFIEIAAGVLFILLAVIILVNGYSPKNTSWFLSVAGEVALAKFFGILTAILILWWLKDRFTYPRTGFVRGNRITAVQVLAIIKNMIVFLLMPILGLLLASILIVSGSAVLSSMPIWFPVGLGILWAVLSILAGEWLGLQRFRLVGLAMLLIGSAVGVWQFALGTSEFSGTASTAMLLEIIGRTLTGMGMLILFTGAALILSGGITFLNYRKENPTPYAEEI